MERVYVGNLPPDIRIKDIDDFFRPFGKLVAIDVNNRSNPAFAFVQFDSPRNALSAARNRHGYDYEGYTLQVKLVENNNVGSFEVRNQRRQITPPPPPPLFNNDFNNQMGGGGFGNNNFGRNIGGNSNFGVNSNFGSNNFGNDNFNNLPSSSSFQRNLPPQNMIQYPTANARSIMPAQNNMIEYPSNNNNWESGRGGNSNRGNSNRGDGSGFSNRGVGGNMGNDFNNMGGGGDYSYNPNNNCYADNNFEDRFTQGLSGSGRKWFNRYIRKGFAPKIAREKAIEHRTLPYLRKGDPNQTLNNTVASLPLPALENFGTKIMSLFSGNNAGNGRNFGGGNANQMMSNFNNWGNNMQGRGFSNDFNMAGTSFSNFRSGNRNNEIRSVVPKRAGAAMNRNGRPNAGKGPESGILDKMLAEVPKGKRKIVAKEIFNKSCAFLKGPITAASDKFKKKYHRQIVQEYQKKFTNSSQSSTNANKAQTLPELKQYYHDRKRKLYQEARALPDYPGGIIPENAKNKIQKLLENGFVQPGATILSKLSKAKINNFVKLKQKYEAAMKIAPKGVAPIDVNKPKSDKETAYQNNKALLTKYEALSRTNVIKSKSLILACLKQIHQYERDMKLKLTKTKFDHLLPIKSEAKKVAKKEQTKDKQNETVSKVEGNLETQNQDSKEIQDKPDEKHENNKDIMEINEEQNDQSDLTEIKIDLTEVKIDLTEDSTDADNVVDLEKEKQNDGNQEEQNEKELLEEED